MTYVQPSNTTTGAFTQYSGMPLFGGIANNMAVQQANMRRGESEAIAVAAAVESRVLPEFDAKVDEMIQKADQRLKYDLRKRLRVAGVLPSVVRARSNESYLRLSAEIAGPDELAGDTGNPAGRSGAGLVISIHESLLNNAINQMKFAGQTMTDAQVAAELQRYLSQIAGRKVDFAAAAKKMAAAQASMPGAPAGACANRSRADGRAKEQQVRVRSGRPDPLHHRRWTDQARDPGRLQAGGTARRPDAGNHGSPAACVATGGRRGHPARNGGRRGRRHASCVPVRSSKRSKRPFRP